MAQGQCLMSVIEQMKLNNRKLNRDKTECFYVVILNADQGIGIQSVLDRVTFT